MDKHKKDVSGNKLIELCKTTGLCLLNGRCETDMQFGKPTTMFDTVIDYVITMPCMLDKITEFVVHDMDPLFSDVHCRISLSFQWHSHEPQGNIENLDKNVYIENKPGKWSHEKGDVFAKNLELSDMTQLLENISNNVDVSITDTLNALSNTLLNSAVKMFGKTKSMPKNYKRNFIVNYNRNCYLLKREYHKAKNNYRKHNSRANLNTLVEKSKRYRKEIKRHKYRVNKELIRKLKKLKDCDPKQYWRLLNTKEKKSNVNATVNDLFDHFKSLYEGGDTCHENLDMEFNSTMLDVTILNEDISGEEIMKTAVKLKNNKSPGNDKIINEYIKGSMKSLLPVYVHLFNKVLKSGEVPYEWTTGIIVPLFKNKGHNTEAKNYRGITLLSCIGKLFTNILNDRLTLFVESNDVLKECQTGFRKNYSTSDHCFVLKCIVDIMLSKKKKLFCAFVDFQTAFDTIWHNGLWFKLSRIGIQGSVYNVITNMYKQTKSRVFAHNTTSDIFVNNIGVRQGENLSPLLFSLYINDLEDYLLENGGSHILTSDAICDKYLKLFLLMYADDTAILANSEKNLQKALNYLWSYCTMWKLKVNSEKSKVMIFSKKKVKKDKFKFTYNGCVLDVVDSFKYLGITFNYNNNFKLCKTTLLNQSSKAMYSLLCKARKLNLPIDLQLELFDYLVLPVLNYGCEIWGSENCKILENLHLKFCKYILGVKNSTPSSVVYGELGRYPIDVSIKTRMIMYWYRLISGKESKHASVLYNCMLKMYENGVFDSPWLKCVNSTLDNAGLSHVWMCQGKNINKTWLKNTLNSTLKDQFVQNWHTQLHETSKLYLYRLFKKEFCLEKYLLNGRYKYLMKFRTINHKLPIEKGRYQNIAREMRLCEICEKDCIADEYHYLFVCNNVEIEKVRNQLIPQYYVQKPNIEKFAKLLNSVSVNTDHAKKLNLFVKEIFKILS
jgi:hypothetical protein